MQILIPKKKHKNNRKKKMVHCSDSTKQSWTLAVNLCKRSTVWRTLRYLLQVMLYHFHHITFSFSLLLYNFQVMKLGMIQTYEILSGKNVFSYFCFPIFFSCCCSISYHLWYYTRKYVRKLMQTTWKSI